MTGFITAWIAGLEGQYSLNTNGEVYNHLFNPPRLIAHSKVNRPNTNYILVQLYDRNLKLRKRYILSRLIWETFRFEKLNRTDTVGFIDNDYTNCKLSNLKVYKREVPNYEKYKVIDETGNNISFKRINEICYIYGLTVKQIKQAIKSGDWVSVIQKKNLE
jgi:uncharacterized protein YnzC (UPF0291/DUF896 family)